MPDQHFLTKAHFLQNFLGYIKIAEEEIPTGNDFKGTKEYKNKYGPKPVTLHFKWT